MDRLRSVSPWDGSVVADLPADAPVVPLFAPPDIPAMHAGLRRLAEVVVERRAVAVELLIREAGKTRADAEAEADLLPRKITITLDQGLARTPLGGSPIRWRARGPALCIGPANFPLHLLHGLVVPALAVGACAIAKPSERTPALGAWYRAGLEAAGLTPWSAVIQGDATVVARLIADLRIATIAAVGSRRMGQALSRMLVDRPETVLALELGGVNHALLCDDADLAAAAPILADGAWRMCGQRCTATRIVHVPHRSLSELIDRLRGEHARWRGDGTPTGPLGPHISVGERERFRVAHTGDVPGFTRLAGEPDARPGTAFSDPLLWLTDAAARINSCYREEHFGPALIVDPYDDEADAIARIAANPHRLAASVWTADADRFTAIAARLPYGLVARNRNTAGARSDLPFGGCGTSGNGRPAALAATAIFADETVVW
jgi:succinylglutamic semialdehyde dehydrogenase